MRCQPRISPSPTAACCPRRKIRGRGAVGPQPLSDRNRLASRPRPAIRAALQFLVIAIFAIVTTPATADTDDGLAFFESRIRPVLVESCYPCHSSQARTPKGGLRVDSRGAMWRGGDHGPVILPGKPDDSLLFKALSYEG